MRPFTSEAKAVRLPQIELIGDVWSSQAEALARQARSTGGGRGRAFGDSLSSALYRMLPTWLGGEAAPATPPQQLVAQARDGISANHTAPATNKGGSARSSGVDAASYGTWHVDDTLAQADVLLLWRSGGVAVSVMDLEAGLGWTLALPPGMGLSSLSVLQPGLWCAVDMVGHRHWLRVTDANVAHGSKTQSRCVPWARNGLDERRGLDEQASATAAGQGPHSEPLAASTPLALQVWPITATPHSPLSEQAAEVVDATGLGRGVFPRATDGAPAPPPPHLSHDASSWSLAHPDAHIQVQSAHERSCA